jgi:hypothetical protein
MHHSKRDAGFVKITEEIKENTATSLKNANQKKACI